MLLRWLDTKETAAFSAIIVEEYCRLRRSTVVQTQKAARKALKYDKLVQKTTIFCKEHRLNFYKRAKLIDFVRTGLAENEVPEPEIEDFVNALLLSGLRRE